MLWLSVDVVTDYIFVIDKQVVITVAAIPVFLAEACCHVAIISWLAPQRTVIATEVKAACGKTFFVLHCLSEEVHFCRSAIFFDCGKPDTLAVDACTGSDVVLVKGLIQIRIGDCAKPVVCMRGKPCKFLVLQNQLPVRIRFLVMGRIIYFLNACPICENMTSFSFSRCNNANDIFVSVDKQTPTLSTNSYIQAGGILFVAEIGFRRMNSNCFHIYKLLSLFMFRVSELCRFWLVCRHGTTRFLRAWSSFLQERCLGYSHGTFRLRSFFRTSCWKT